MAQDFLVFQQLSSYFRSKSGKIGWWQSERISEESIEPPSTSAIILIQK